MEIVISGGTGLIGTALANLLLEKGHKITILTRQITALPHATKAKYVNWDAIHSDPWTSELEHCDAVINLSGANIGASRWSEERINLIETSRVFAGRLLVDAIRKANHRPSYFIQASAIGYYGTSLTDTFDESSPVGSDTLANIAHKWEESSLEVESLGIKRAIIRTGVVLAAQSGAFPRLLLPFRLFVGGPLGSGKQWISWIHLADEIGIILYLLENQFPGVFNLTSPDAVTNAEFGRTLAGVLHRPYWVPVPAFALKTIFGEMSTLILDGQHVYPEKLLEIGYPFQFPKLTDALIDLTKK